MKYALNLAGMGNFRFKICFCPSMRLCYVIHSRIPGQRSSWNVCVICFVNLFFHQFICSFTKCWLLSVWHGAGVGDTTMPCTCQCHGDSTTNDSYTPMWINSVLGEVHNALKEFGVSVNLAGGGSRKTKTPRMKWKEPGEGEAESTEWQAVGKAKGIMWLP